MWPNWRVATPRTLTPTPLPTEEGLNEELPASLLPSGEGAPQGRMRVRAKLRVVQLASGFAPYPHPNPSPVGERLAAVIAAILRAGIKPASSR
ncbi:hypothetical protein XHV734_3195 [Xanthomonas hortorum pv. vitians]|nr:hypothetical protein XHV734_3195 [Xanthomonas hortorum pv. vitians]